MPSLVDHLKAELKTVRTGGLYKPERVITSAQSAEITLQSGKSVLNLCANNYLGLAGHPASVEAAHKALDEYGFGMASVRFICGTQGIHKELERRLSAFLKTEDTILYSSCFDANGGLFETILDENDSVVSDALNHASIIDGIRLCKAQRYRYNNNDMDDLERCLKEAQKSRFRLIATDGVFSMDGSFANLPAICALAEKYDAMVMVDDSHAVGFIGETGAGTPEHFGVRDRVHIITGTLGKALGGASGGYTSGNATIIEWLRQRSRPYLFSNTLAPVITATAIATLDFLATEAGAALRQAVKENSAYFREKLAKAGFDLLPGEHPIIPVMIYDAAKAGLFAEAMLKRGIYVVGFSYPVVPQNKARIRTQMSAAHEKKHLDIAVAAFESTGRELGIVS